MLRVWSSAVDILGDSCDTYEMRLSGRIIDHKGHGFCFVLFFKNAVTLDISFILPFMATIMERGTFSHGFLLWCIMLPQAQTNCSVWTEAVDFEPN